MKFSRLLVALVPLFLAACGLSEQQKADYASVERAGVSPAIYDKMLHGDALSISDIEALSRARVNSGVILRYIRDQGTVYFLTSSDVTSMHKAGVDSSIIDYMLRTATGGYWGAGPYAYPYGPYWWNDPYFYGPGFYPGIYFYGGGHYHGHHH
jgi:hypothetical protein